MTENRPDFDDYIKKTSGFMLVQDTVEKRATVREFRKLTIFLFLYICIVSQSICVQISGNLFETMKNEQRTHWTIYVELDAIVIYHLFR